MKNYIKKSFKRQLLVCFLIVAVLPLIVCCVFMIQIFKIKMERDYQKKDMAQAALVGDRLTVIFEQFGDIAEELTADEQVKEALCSDYYDVRNTVYARLYEVTAQVRETAQFDLYSYDGICQYSTGMQMFHSRLPVYWGVLREAKYRQGELVTRREKDYTGRSGALLRLARIILDDQGDCIGFLVISMGEAHFDHVLQGTYSSEDGICILDQFLENIYSTGTAAQKDVGTTIRNRFLRGMALSGDYGENSVYLSEIGSTGLYGVLVRPQIFTADIVGTMYRVLFVMAALSFLLCIAVSARLSSYLSRPICVLNEAMHEVQEGNLDVKVQSGRSDEFGQLSKNFDIMTSELKGYMKRQVQQQKQLNEVQIAMMQAQLNPHFLYNTLDTMKWVAKANHIPEIATMSAKLAKILRASISRNSFITLKEEMDLVDGYMQIQMIRFSRRFVYEYELPDSLEQVMVPKLIVQPVVENAVIHGLVECEEGHVWVRVLGREDRLYIEVTDDGCGISQEVMEQINGGDREKRNDHIGLYNVDNIIRLHYGLEYGIKVSKREEGGTRVVIMLPIKKGGAET